MIFPMWPGTSCPFDEDSLMAATALHFDHAVLTANTAHAALTGASVLNPLG
jgi:predicted nucleic acid-binding protein